MTSNFNQHDPNYGHYDSVQIYDSGLVLNTSLSTKRTICSFLKPSADTLHFEIMNIQGQNNSYDCGIFAVACATELAYEKDPVMCSWDTQQMRQHLISCLEQGQMHRFPIKKIRRIGLGMRIRSSTKESIYCFCRMPDDRSTPMIQCGSCKKWYHLACMALDEDGSYSDVNWVCSSCNDFFS